MNAHGDGILPPRIDDDSFTESERFEAVRPLGEGGMGEVFEAFDRERGIRLAIKALKVKDPDRIRRFKEEFRALSDLHHPNLASFGELFEKDGRWWFTMERLYGVEFLAHVRSETNDGGTASRSTHSRDAFASSPSDSDVTPGTHAGVAHASTTVRTDGATHTSATDTRTSVADRATIRPPSPPSDAETLADAPTSESDPTSDSMARSSVRPTSPRVGALRGWRPAWEARLRDTLAQLATGLSFLHRAGMIHRDIKSANILVEPDGRVVLLDFGLVAEFASGGREDQIVGTATYMAPEQIRGDALTPAADWYAVGVLLFRALSGLAPFAGSGPAIMDAKLHDRPLDVRDIVPEAPADLADLCMRLLEREPHDRPSDEEIRAVLGADAPDAWQGLSSLAGVAQPPFVGRETELAALRRALAESASGTFVSVVLDGASGIGKSRLVQEFANQVGSENRKAWILRGRCHEKEAVLFKAFDAVIDQLARSLGGMRKRELGAALPSNLGPLCTVFPALRSVKAIAERLEATDDSALAESDPTELRLLAFDALRALLSSVATERHVLLIIDDLQWADADSVALVAEVFGKVSPPPVLFVATARGTDGAELPLVRALGRRCRTMRIEGLEQHAAVELAQRLGRQTESGLDALDAVRIGHLVEETLGHPMLIDELMRHARTARGSPAHAGGLDDALRARAASLGPDCLELLRVVSASTRPLAHRTIAKAAGIDGTDYAERANRLRAARLVRISGVRQTDTVEPYHSRVGEAVYTAIPPDDSRATHRRLAEALEVHAGAPDDIAAHFFRGGAEARAVPYFVLAGDAARASLAFERAASLYQEAKSISLRAAELPKRSLRELLVKLGECLHLDGSSEAAAREFEQAAALETEDDDVGQGPTGVALELLTRAAELFLQNGNIDEGRRASEHLLSTFDVTLPGSTIAAIVRFAYYDLRLTLHRFRWKKVAEEDLDRREIQLLDAYTALAGGLGMVDPIVANVLMAKGVLLAVEAGEPRRLARTLGWQAGSYFALDRGKTGDKLVDACRRACEADESGKGWFYVTQAQLIKVLLCENDWPRVFELVEKGRAQWRESQEGFANEMELFYQFNCWALEQAGQVAMLHDQVERRVEWAKRHGNRFIVVTYRSLFVLPSLTNDEPERALAELEAAIASWPVDPDLLSLQEHMAHRSRTLVALYRDREGSERESLGAGWTRYFRSLLTQTPFIRQDAHVVAGHLELALAVSARAAGQGLVAWNRLRRARAHARKLASIRLPIARLGHAELMGSTAHVSGDTAAAVKWLRVALDTAQALHCRLRAACIGEVLARLVDDKEAASLRAEARNIAESVAVRNLDRIVAMQLPAWKHPAPYDAVAALPAKATDPPPAR